jgi:GNAT superfamily N-acetyltransferase
MDERAEHRQIVSLCEQTQTEWFRLRAQRLGGEVWEDGPLLWIDGPDGLNLMFPESFPAAELRRGIEYARDKKRSLVSAWVGGETDATQLTLAGFERGWAPWWMAAPLDSIEAPHDERVHVGVLPEDIVDEEEHDGDGRLLELARLEPGHALYAAVRVDGILAGHAWSLVEGDVAGIFDLDVWPPFRRRGLGAALLHSIAGAAREAGARTAALSTSPQGAIVYRAQGFTRVGMGATWWLQLD